MYAHNVHRNNSDVLFVNNLIITIYEIYISLHVVELKIQRTRGFDLLTKNYTARWSHYKNELSSTYLTHLSEL